MYHLWWTRERILYMGKDLHEQRVEVFHRAGIAEPLLNAAEQIMGSWPRDIRYSVKGIIINFLTSNISLFPASPVWARPFPWKKRTSSSPVSSDPFEKDKPIEIQSSLHGLLLSLFLLSGIALLLRLGFRVPFLSIPEYAGMAVFILAGLVIASRGFLGEATTGFWFIAVAGFVGWIIHIPSLYNVMRTFMRRILQFVTDPLCKKSRNHKIPYFLPALLAAIAMAVLFWSILMSVVVVPDDWDAWAIWGAKAKVLALGWGPLKDVTAFGHPDYPLSGLQSGLLPDGAAAAGRSTGPGVGADIHDPFCVANRCCHPAPHRTERSGMDRRCPFPVYAHGSPSRFLELR